jgi:diaminohydroxyphosphoribosylaminopyrimidine deaminase/5-amino-6-(5-phosphoribosylamino)uracil reductase
MRRALRLARQSDTLPYPNPWVGCVIVRGGKIVGRGRHRGPGTNHAEVEALAQAGARAQGAALYVTLEPCCHYGRTPPCTDAILRAGIHKVFYALRDPNPLVAGRSAKTLKARGLAVDGGLCSREAALLNEVYLKYVATGLPFVTVKVATSLDGKIATKTGESKWITDADARRHARQLRAEHQAVLVGINTVLADNPHLGSRKRGMPDPWRIVLDSRLRIPPASQVVKSQKCIIACTEFASLTKRTQLERRGAQVWTFKGRRVPLKKLLARLAEHETISVLVEGGSEVLGSFFDQKLVDRVYWFLTPIILGSQQSRTTVAGNGVDALADAPRLTQPRIEPVGNSWLIRGNLSRWARPTK